MAKPIQYYVLARGGLYSRHGFTVLGVTSEAYGQVYGRTVPGDEITHIARGDIIYQFPEGTDPQFAMDAGKRADAERQRHEVGIVQASDQLERLRKARDLAVLDATKGLAPVGDFHPAGTLPETKLVGVLRDYLSSNHVPPDTGRPCRMCKPGWGHNAVGSDMSLRRDNTGPPDAPDTTRAKTALVDRGSHFYCTTCDRGTSRDFCPQCGAGVCERTT